MIRLTSRVLLPLASVVALAGCGAGSSTPAAAPSTTTTGTAPSAGGQAAGSPVVVTLRGLRFEPAEVTVAVGQPVQWRDGEDVAHTVTTGTYSVTGDGGRIGERADGRLDRVVDGTGSTVTYAFTSPGRYQYFCSYHQRMQGVVVVR